MMRDLAVETAGLRRSEEIPARPEAPTGLFPPDVHHLSRPDTSLCPKFAPESQRIPTP